MSHTIIIQGGGLNIFYDDQNFDYVDLIFVQQYEDSSPDRAVVEYPMETFVESLLNGFPAIDMPSVTFVDAGIKARVISIVASVIKKRMNLVV